MATKAGKHVIHELTGISSEIRRDIIEMIYRAGSGHPGGSLSAVEILVALYFKTMKINPENPEMPKRDRFVLSKGHGAPALYATLSKRGYFKKEELSTLRKIGSCLQGHPDMKKTPGVDFSSGSLGQGLSVGCGMALGAKMNSVKNRIFVLMGDGELDEGQIWEAAMSASKFRLDNLTGIIDHNGVQLDGTTDEIMPLNFLCEKWKAFGWNVIEADGHEIAAVIDALKQAASYKEGPSVILARTIKGKGVSFMENNFLWHGKVITCDEYEKALKELI